MSKWDIRMQLKRAEEEVGCGIFSGDRRARKQQASSNNIPSCKQDSEPKLLCAPSLRVLKMTQEVVSVLSEVPQLEHNDTVGGEMDVENKRRAFIEPSNSWWKL
jgi:hypothetical protein